MNVSVVIGTYGDSAWSDLAWSRAYPSAVAQQPYEIIVRHEPDATLAEVRNTLAAEATGDWLCYCDADDLLEPGYLAAMAMAKANGGWIYPEVEPPWSTAPPPLLVPAVRRVFSDGHEEGPGIPNQGRWPVLNECVIGTLIRRDQFEKLGGFRDFPLYEDWDLWLRAYKDGARLVYVEDAVYRECVNPGGRNSAANAREIYDRIWADYVG